MWMWERAVTADWIRFRGVAEWLGHCDEQLGHWGGYLATLLGGESTLKKLLEYAVLMAVVGLVLDLDLAKVFQVIIPFAGALLLLPTFPRLEEPIYQDGERKRTALVAPEVAKSSHVVSQHPTGPRKIGGDESPRPWLVRVALFFFSQAGSSCYVLC
jgi:hypothetical protein